MKNLQSGNNNLINMKRMKAVQSHAVMESPFEEDTSTLPNNIIKP